MQKKTKLKLSKTTIRNLSNPELEHAAGGNTHGVICAAIFCMKSGSCTAAVNCTAGCKGR